jgi:hypothetical protein
MKKVTVILILISLASSALVACGAKKEAQSPVKSSSKSASTAESSVTSKSSEVSKPSESVASSNETVKTSDAQASDLTQARLMLYQAGIDSSSISDEQILEYWEAAQKQKIDFVKYVQDKL